MAIANKFYRAKTPEEQEHYAELYKASLQPYPVDVSEYRMPELLMPKQDVAEDISRRGFLKGAGAMAAGISAGGARADNHTDPNKLIAIVNIDGESKEFNLTGRFKGDVKSQLHQAEEFITEFLEKRDINFSNLELRYQRAVLKTQNIGSVKEEQGVTEAFTHPFRIDWEKSDYGDWDAIATVSDSTPLHIMFNQEGNDEWQVEFYRSNTQSITGEGDAQRIFSTVLSAIQQFIQKEQPWRVIFSASKDVEPGQNNQSRAKLYNSLVKRYARAWGYDEYSEDHGDQVTYELTKLKQNG
jgi:hypothetical protein